MNVDSGEQTTPRITLEDRLAMTEPPPRETFSKEDIDPVTVRERLQLDNAETSKDIPFKNQVFAYKELKGRKPGEPSIISAEIISEGGERLEAPMFPRDWIMAVGDPDLPLQYKFFKRADENQKAEALNYVQKAKIVRQEQDPLVLVQMEIKDAKREEYYGKKSMFSLDKFMEHLKQDKEAPMNQLLINSTVHMPEARGNY